MRPPLAVALLLAVLTVVGASPASGQQVVYDTYVFGDANPDRTVGLFEGPNYQYADPFVLDVGGAAVRLEVLTLRLRTKPLLDPGTDFVVRFREDDQGIPGTVLESWIVPLSNQLSFQNIELFSELRPELNDGSVYWINVASNSDAGYGLWANAATNTLDWLAATTRDEDPIWVEPPPTSLLRGRGMARVEVPEPGPVWSAASTALALTLLVALRRRRSG